MHNGEEGRFEPANQKAVGGQFGKACHPELEQGKNAPSNIKKWKKIMNGDICEKEEEGYLSKNSAQDIERLELNELIALEPKIFLQTSNVGIVC